MALSKFLHGNKTYIAGIATLVGALSGYASGELDQQTALTISVTAILATLLRAGSKGDTRVAVAAADEAATQAQIATSAASGAVHKAELAVAAASSTTTSILNAVDTVQQTVDTIKTITKK